MFVHMSIHHPQLGQEQNLIESMYRFGEAMKGQPGFQQVYVLKDQSTDALVGIAIWDTQESCVACRPLLENAIKDDDFDSWETEPPLVYHLDQVSTHPG